MTTRRKRLLCRTGLRHHWELAKTSDGTAYIRCAKCFKERWTGLDSDRSTTAALITHYGSPH